MICCKKCPRETGCRPISNIVATNKKSFVCIGYHGTKKKYNDDIFRHCFKSVDTDSMFDYDEYDIKSVLSVMAEALLTEELKK